MTKRFPSGLPVFCPNTFCPTLSVAETSCPHQITRLKRLIIRIGVPHASLLDYFCDLNRDYPGRFFDPEAGFLDPETGRFLEAYVDTEPLEDAPVEWWRDQFSSELAAKPIIRVRSEARPRWQALGSIYFAWHPRDRLAWNRAAANDNRPRTG